MAGGGRSRRRGIWGSRTFGESLEEEAALHPQHERDEHRARHAVEKAGGPGPTLLIVGREVLHQRRELRVAAQLHAKAAERAHELLRAEPVAVDLARVVHPDEVLAQLRLDLIRRRRAHPPLHPAQPRGPPARDVRVVKRDVERAQSAAEERSGEQPEEWRRRVRRADCFGDLLVRLGP